MVTFLVNSEKPRDAAMRNTGTGFVVLSHHSLFAGSLVRLFVTLVVFIEKLMTFGTCSASVPNFTVNF